MSVINGKFLHVKRHNFFWREKNFIRPEWNWFIRTYVPTFSQFEKEKNAFKLTVETLAQDVFLYIFQRHKALVLCQQLIWKRGRELSAFLHDKKKLIMM